MAAPACLLLPTPNPLSVPSSKGLGNQELGVKTGSYLHDLNQLETEVQPTERAAVTLPDH